MAAIRISLAAGLCCLCCTAWSDARAEPPLVTVEATPVSSQTNMPIAPIPASDWYVGVPSIEPQTAIQPHPVIDSEPIVESNVSACPKCASGNCYGVCTDPGWPRKPLINKPGDRDRGDCPPKRYRIPDCQRSGHPHHVAPWATCSVDGKYSSWFVGGGTPFAKGRPRKRTEGTWGLDYGGLFGHAHVWLKYTRFHRNQGGEGAYATDGEPALVKKVHSIFH